MSVERDSRATFMFGRATWVVAIGMVLALAGSSFAMLPATRAQDGSYSVRVVNVVRYCERDIDLATIVQYGDRQDECRDGDALVDDFMYSAPGDLDPGRDGIPNAGDFDAGPLAVTEVVAQPWDAPAVYCSSFNRIDGTDLFNDVAYGVGVAQASGSPRTAYTISLDTVDDQEVHCWWYHLADTLPDSPIPPFDTVNASAFSCPAGIARPSVNADGLAYSPLRDACTTPLDATFELVDATGTRTQDAGGDGLAVFTDVDMGDDRAVQLTETAPGGRGDLVVFCTNRYVGDGYLPQPHAAGSITLIPNNHVDGTAECSFFHFSGPELVEPVVEITPPIQNPDIVVTPVVPVQLPTSTPAMPQLEVTPVEHLPDPVITPVAPIQLPTPTPTPAPEIGEPPVIVITPVIEVPIEIVTPIIPIGPIVPTEPPELIHGEPGGEAIG